jgi:molecular chaperone GrpE
MAAKEKEHNEAKEAQEEHVEEQTTTADEEALIEEHEENAPSREEQLEAELAEMKDKYTRLFAEFDNFRKRTAKERIGLINNAGADVIKNLLPVLDDFDRAKKANEGSEDASAVKEGFDLIHNKFFRLLEQKGLKPMDSQGKPFDTEYHEAITDIPAPSEDLKGKVVDVIEPGYFMNDTVLRYAKVVVGK